MIIKDGKILLIHRKKNGEEYWVLPGGGIEDGETPQETVIREVDEETGLKITNCKLWFRENFEFRDKTRYNHIFSCDVDDLQTTLGGEEAKAHSDQDWYNLEWLDQSHLSGINLLPIEIKDRIMKKG